ncbi:tripartite tricarboxylate transporter substrate binding protein [Martelella limonii]|uniref:tripartite tricarboxylate transporter substrate binding protein n=1 Tax=Martelella limonii TaxID=1647649 RepID=UPI001580B9AD|nr:tripartite tricarboxylate transporter substrate binding protein [Martelella limonii]
MFDKLRLFATAGVMAAGLLAGAPAATAQDYPDRSIDWILMWSPGGGADTATRIFTKYYEEELGQPITVQNVTGASGTIGYMTARDADPDGYTLTTALSDLPKYKPLGTPGIEVDNFDILGSFAVEAPVLVAPADSEIETLDDFIRLSKENPDGLSIGVTNIGGIHHQPLVLLAEAADIRINVVAHEGTPQVNAALLGGHIDLISSFAKQSLAHVQSGDMRYIAYFGATRTKALPDVPTARELGYDIVWEHSYGVATPKGAPEEVKARLTAALETVRENTDFQAELDTVGLSLHSVGPEDYREELLETSRQMEHVVELMRQQ